MSWLVYVLTCLETEEMEKSLKKNHHSKGFSLLFPDTFCIRNWNHEHNQILLKVILFKDFVFSPVSWHFPYSKVSRNRKTTKSLWKSNFSRKFVFLLFLDTFCIQKCLETIQIIKYNNKCTNMPWRSHFLVNTFKKYLYNECTALSAARTNNNLYFASSQDG